MSLGKLSLKGKVAVVTGSSSGIGEATALLMADRGAELTIHGRRQDKLQEVANKIEEISGKKPLMVLGDITSEEVQKELIEGTIARFSRIDVLVNNAGMMKVGGWQDINAEDMKEMLDMHVVAPYMLSRMAIPQLILNKGSIVMVSSIAGIRGVSRFVSYSAAKGGMDNMMRSLAADLAKDGVRVNSVNPGGTNTELCRYDDTRALLAEVMANPSQTAICPMGRMIEPSEIAEVISFLASDAASMISGCAHAVDGAKTNTIFFE